MKRCPECRRDYFDDSLIYCLDDGAQLLEGPSSADEKPTSIFPEESASLGGPSSERKTQVLTTEITTGGLKPRYKYAIGLLLVVIVIGAGWVGWKYFARNEVGPDLQNFTLTRVTTSGRAQEADISPDGKYVVYLDMEDDGDRGLWIRQLATGNVIPIVPPTKGNVLKSTTFSRDGNFVYYLFTDRTRPTSLYQVSSLGGTPRKILDRCDSAVAVSPDGQRLAYVRWYDESKATLYTSLADGSDEKALATLEGTEWFSKDGPSWSPDGKTIAVGGGVIVDGVESARLTGVSTEDGSIRELTGKRWLAVGRVVWMPDGGSLLLTAMEKISDGGSQLWQVQHSSGSATRVTNDVLSRDQSSLGITADGRTIATVTEQRRSRIESIPATGQIDRVTKISTAETDIDGLVGFAALSDGRIIFSSSEGGQPDIWIMNADGSGRRKLTSDTHWDGSLSVSPDEKYIVFVSNRPAGDGLPRLWRMNTDGTNLVQLAAPAFTTPSISLDGQWVIYSYWSPADKKQLLWKVHINGGESVRVTDYSVFDSASFSPDGKWIGGYYTDGTDRWKYGIIPPEGGRPVKTFEFPSFQYEWVRWTRDSRSLSFIGVPPDPSNIWLQPVDGGEPRKLTDFKTDYIFRHEWSRDGKTLYLVRGRPSFDVVLQTAAKQQ